MEAGTHRLNASERYYAADRAALHVSRRLTSLAADGRRRWAFPRNELRSSGLIQASLISFILGFAFRHVPAIAPTHWWAYALTAYAAGASVFPWLLGGIEREEFSLRLSVALGIVYALPCAVAAAWLRPTPYHALAFIDQLFVGLWLVHFLIAIVLLFVPRKPSPADATP